MTDTSSKSSVPTWGMLAFSVVLIVFIGIGVVPLVWAYQGIREARESNAWPQTDGTIITSSVQVSESRTRRDDQNHREVVTYSYSAEIQYEFQVAGTSYRGSRITVVSDQFGSEAYARATCDKYPHGKRVTVFYNPRNPAECVLEPGQWGGVGFELLFAGFFIIVPAMILKGIWSKPAREVGLNSPEHRIRWDTEFRERFIEWDPGQRVHLHRDHRGFVAVIGAGLIVGCLGGAVLGLAPAWYFFSAKGPLVIAQIYAAISVVLSIVCIVWLGIDGLRRDTLIEWSRQSVRMQVGWFAKQYMLSEVEGVSVHVPAMPKRQPGQTPDNVTKAFTARVKLKVAGKKYTILQVECDRDDLRTMRGRLRPAANELAISLKVPLEA